MGDETRGGEPRQDSGAFGRTDLDDGAQLLGEQHRERIAAHVIERDGEAATRREGHLAQRREQSAVGDVVVRKQPAFGGEVWIVAKNADRRAGSSRSGATSPS